MARLPLLSVLARLVGYRKIEPTSTSPAEDPEVGPPRSHAFLSLRAMVVALNALGAAFGLLIGILLLSGFLSWLKGGVLSVSIHPGARSINLQSLIRAPEVRWDRYPHTLVLVLRSTCVYCEESVPFHRALVDFSSDTKRATYQALVVTDDPISRMQAMLKAERIAVPVVNAAPLEGLGVFGTPALLLVDRRGDVVKSWQGLLSPEREREVARFLGIAALQTAVPVATPLFAAPQIPFSEVAGAVRETVLDIRSRAEFAQGHIDGAINIPADELDARAPHELVPGHPVAVFCQLQPSCYSPQATRSVFNHCAVRTVMLSGMGFEARWLPESLETIERAGVRIVRSGSAEPASPL